MQLPTAELAGASPSARRASVTEWRDKVLSFLPIFHFFHNTHNLSAITKLIFKELITHASTKWKNR
jgi:hypothetical protein